MLGFLGFLVLVTTSRSSGVGRLGSTGLASPDADLISFGSRSFVVFSPVTVDCQCAGEGAIFIFGVARLGLPPPLLRAVFRVEFTIRSQSRRDAQASADANTDAVLPISMPSPAFFPYHSLIVPTESAISTSASCRCNSVPSRLWFPTPPLQ